MRTIDSIVNRVNRLMLLWASCTAPEDLVSGAIYGPLVEIPLPFTHGSVSHIPNKPVDRPFPSPFFVFSLSKLREMSAIRIF